MDIEKNSSKEVGNIIKKYRVENKMTQSEIAERLHVSASAVSKWERGITIPDVYMLQELAEVFGVPLTALFYKDQEQVLGQEEVFSTNAKKHHKHKLIALLFMLLVIILIGVLVGIDLYVFRPHIVDEYWDMSPEITEYQAVYCISVEYKGKITSENAIEFAESIRSNYEDKFTKADAIIVTYWKSYSGKNESMLFADSVTVLLPENYDEMNAN